MKKFVLALFLLGLVGTLAACGGTAEQGEYTPGVYHGYTVGNEPSIAVVTVDENGMIESVLIDEVYLQSEEGGEITWEGRGGPTDGIATTKRALDDGCAYDMHGGVENCSVEGEMMWWEQVDALGQAVVDAQGVPTDWSIVEGSFENPSDAVAGVSITVDTYISAIEDALDKAQ